MNSGRFAKLKVGTAPYGIEGTFVTDIQVIGPERQGVVHVIPLEKYMNVFPDVEIKLGHIPQFQLIAGEIDLNLMANDISDLILHLTTGDIVGIITTHAEVKALIDFFNDFDLGRLEETRLADFILSPDLHIRIAK